MSKRTSPYVTVEKRPLVPEVVKESASIHMVGIQHVGGGLRGYQALECELTVDANGDIHGRVIRRGPLDNIRDASERARTMLDGAMTPQPRRLHRAG